MINHYHRFTLYYSTPLYTPYLVFFPDYFHDIIYKTCFLILKTGA